MHRHSVSALKPQALQTFLQDLLLNPLSISLCSALLIVTKFCKLKVKEERVCQANRFNSVEITDIWCQRYCRRPGAVRAQTLWLWMLPRFVSGQNPRDQE